MTMYFADGGSFVSDTVGIYADGEFFWFEAAAAGITIPIFMHHYKMQMGA